MSVKYFFITSLCIFLVSCANKVASGDFRTLDPNSLRQLQIEGLDDFDHAHGTIVKYYANDKLQQEIPLIQGHIEGLAIGYYPDKNSTEGLVSGEVQTIEYARDTVQMNYAFIVHENNQSLQEARTNANSIEQEAQYYQSKLHGKYLLRYRNGKRQVDEFYQHSKREGFRKDYYPSGELKSITTYLQDRKESLFEQYSESGNIEVQLMYENGVPLRLLTYYPQGFIFARTTYLEGKIAQVLYYTKEGQLLAQMQDEVFTKYHSNKRAHYSIPTTIFSSATTNDVEIIEYDEMGNIKQVVLLQSKQNSQYPIIRKIYYKDGTLKSHALIEEANLRAIKEFVQIFVAGENLHQVADIEAYLLTSLEKTDFILIIRGKETIFNRDGSIQQEVIH